MNFMFACGGTAGHINPALAVAGQLRKRSKEDNILFIGVDGNMETELVPLAGYPIKTVTVSSLHRSFKPKEIVHNLNSAKNIVVSQVQARKIIKEFSPDVVIGTGGYVCYPVIRQAAKLHIPTIVHESNAVPGLTTKMLEGCVDKIMVGFEDSKNAYKNQQKVEFTGTPVRGEFLQIDKQQAKKMLGIEGKPLVLSFWGSLGASHMNSLMAEFIECNVKSRAFIHKHAMGNAEKRLPELLKEKGIDLEKETETDLRQYIFDMPIAMQAADVIICRAGASTLSELAVTGKPVILVPSPNVTNNHQEKNARLLESRGAAKVILEKECSGKLLFDSVCELLADSEKMENMSEAVRKMGSADATERMTRTVLELASN